MLDEFNALVVLIVMKYLALWINLSLFEQI